MLNFGPSQHEPFFWRRVGWLISNPGANRSRIFVGRGGGRVVKGKERNLKQMYVDTRNKHDKRTYVKKTHLQP